MSCVDPASRMAGLPPSAILVRTGLSHPEDLCVAAINCAEQLGSFGLTFWSWPGLTADEIVLHVRSDAVARRSKNPVPHTLLRWVTVGTLLDRNQQFRLEKTGPPGHFTLHLPICEDVEQVGVQGLLGGDSGNVIADVCVVLCTPQSNPAKGAFDAGN